MSRGRPRSPVLFTLFKHITISGMPAATFELHDYVGVPIPQWPAHLLLPWIWTGAVSKAHGWPQSRLGHPLRLLYNTFVGGLTKHYWLSNTEKTNVNPATAVLRLPCGNPQPKHYRFKAEDFLNLEVPVDAPIEQALDFGADQSAADLADLVESLEYAYTSAPFTTWDEYVDRFTPDFEDVLPKDQHEALSAAGILPRLQGTPKYVNNQSQEGSYENETTVTAGTESTPDHRLD